MAVAVSVTPLLAGTIRLDAPCSAQPGATITVEVELAAFATDVAAVQGAVVFDPAALAPVDLTAPGDGPFATGPRASRPDGPGRIGFAALDCAGGAPPADDVPVAAVLRFQVLAPAGAALTIGLENVTALEADGAAAPADVAGASVLVFELPDRDCDGILDVDDNCPDIANPDQADSDLDGIGDACEPLIAQLVAFDAAPWRRRSVLVTWETASEFDTVGFHLYRATTDGGPWTRLTGALIPAAGGPSLGASYEFLDRQPPVGRVFYRLEEIDSGGRPHAFPPIDVRLPVHRAPKREIGGQARPAGRGEP